MRNRIAMLMVLLASGAAALLGAFFLFDGEDGGTPSSPAPALIENSRGVVGGPRDETAFTFDLEPETPGDKPPVLDGVPALSKEVTERLEGFLGGRQTRIASVDPKGPAFTVLTRLEEVSQAYRIRRPLGPLEKLTQGRDPAAQVLRVPGDGDRFLIRRDRDGDEQFQLYWHETESAEELLLTDGSSRHGALSMSRTGRIAFSSNQRSAGDMDLVVAHAEPALQTTILVDRGGQWLAGSWSPLEDKLFARQYRSADSSSLFLIHVEDRQISELSLGRGESVMRDGRFGLSEDAVYVVSDGGEDVAQLFELSLATHDVRALTADLPWDVELVSVSRDRSQLAVATNEDGYSVLYLLDPASGERERLENLPEGVVSSLQFVGASALALTLSSATEPAEAYLYDLGTSELQRWTRSTSEALQQKHRIAPELIRFTSFDGLEIPAFVYRPPLDEDEEAPVLLWIHGGPEEQHRPSFDPLIQFFLLELGIAVIAPNIRGSTGYGRRYLALDDGLRRMDAIRDIGALLDWIAATQGLDSGRVGIYGASYGGFVVLGSLVEYGDRFAAGCDLVGISHFVSFLENTSEYRQNARRAEYGDERDPEVRAFLEEISPLEQAHRIQTPLLVGHGANDPRVPEREARQIVDAVRENGSEVWYVLAGDEGHVFRKRRSRDLFYSVMATFFQRFLVGSPAAEDVDAGPGGDAGAD